MGFYTESEAKWCEPWASGEDTCGSDLWVSVRVTKENASCTAMVTKVHGMQQGGPSILASYTTSFLTWKVWRMHDKTLVCDDQGWQQDAVYVLFKLLFQVTKLKSLSLIRYQPAQLGFLECGTLLYCPCDPQLFHLKNNVQRDSSVWEAHATW